MSNTCSICGEVGHNSNSFKHLETKVCAICNQELPIGAFRLHRYYLVPGDRSTLKMYPSSICAGCARDKRNQERNGSFRGRLFVVLKSAKNRAKEDGLLFDLDLDFLLDLLCVQHQCCYYTGRLMTASAGRDKVSLDKKNPALGYTRSNVVLCCWLVNQIKRDLSDVEFVQICTEIAGSNSAVSLL